MLSSLISRLGSFGTQLTWSFASRLVSAFLQMAVIGLLAHALAPARFGFVSSVNTVLYVISLVNGFGLLRQMQVRRSLDPNHPELPSLFVLRLRFTYLSAALWLLGWLIAWCITRDSMVLAIVPTTLWLAAEQTTSTWNAISIVDGENQRLMPSYLYRRLPVVLCLIAALFLHFNAIWAWSIGLGGGSVLAYWRGLHTQPQWARVGWPRRSLMTTKLDLDFAFWWNMVGDQVRDLDVATVAMMNAHISGIYALPARLVRPMNIVTQAASIVAFPRLVRRKIVTGRDLVLGVVFGNAPVVLIAACVAVLAPLVPDVVGEKYRNSVLPLQILCIAAVVSGGIMLLSAYLQARSGSGNKRAGYTHLTFGTLQVVLAPLGAYWSGATGAALAALTAQGMNFIALCIWSRHQCRAERNERRGLVPGGSREAAWPSNT